jgi:hypothetical protein
VYNKTYYFLNMTSSSWSPPLRKHSSNLHPSGSDIKTVLTIARFCAATCTLSLMFSIVKYGRPVGIYDAYDLPLATQSSVLCSALQVEALWWADPPSKESYQYA